MYTNDQIERREECKHGKVACVLCPPKTVTVSKPMSLEDLVYWLVDRGYITDLGSTIPQILLDLTNVISTHWPRLSPRTY